MPSDLYAERLRLTTGSLIQFQWTLSTFSGTDPNGTVAEPSGSIVRTQDGRQWINVDGNTVWHPYGPTKFDTIFSGSITGTLDEILLRNLSVGADITASVDMRVGRDGTVVGGWTAQKLTASLDARIGRDLVVVGGLTAQRLTASLDALVSGSITGSALLVRRSATSISPVAGTWMVLENNSGDTNFSILGNSNKGIHFANTASNVDGGFVYDNPSAVRGLQIRTGGNTTQVTVDSLGYTLVHKNLGVSGSVTGSGDATFSRKVGIGTSAPAAALHLSGTSHAFVCGDAGALASTAGPGLLLKFTGLRGQVFSYDYTQAIPRPLDLQAFGGGMTVGADTNVFGILTASADVQVRGSVTASMVLAKKTTSGVGWHSSSLIVADNAGVPVSISINGNQGQFKALFFANGYSVVDGGILYDDNDNGFFRGFEFRTGGNQTYLTLDQSGSLNVKGQLTASDGALVNGSARVLGSLSGTGDGKFSRNLTVAGSVTASLDMTVTRDLRVSGNVALGNATTDTHAVYGTVDFNGTAGASSQILAMFNNLPQWIALSGAGGVSGFGTDTKVPKWVGTPAGGGGIAYAIGDSLLSDFSGTVTCDGVFAAQGGGGNGSSGQIYVIVTGSSPPLTRDSTGIGINASPVHVTTGSAWSNYGIKVLAQATRSNGANGLTNYGVYIDAVRGDAAYDGTNNYALYTKTGDNRLGETVGAGSYTSVGGTLRGEADVVLNNNPGGFSTTVKGLSTFHSGVNVLGSITGSGLLVQGSNPNRFTNGAGTVDLYVAIDSTFNRSQVNAGYGVNATDRLYLNLNGYQGSTTQFRDTGIYDGKNNLLLETIGSTKVTKAYGDLNVVGSVTGTVGIFTSGTVTASLEIRSPTTVGLNLHHGFRYFDDLINDKNSVVVLGTATTFLVNVSEPKHQGIGRLTVNTSGSSFGNINVGGQSSFSSLFTPGGGPMTMEALVRMPTLSNGTNNASFRFGLADATITPASNGVLFLYDRSRFGNDNLRLVTAATGSRVEQNTGIPARANDWMLLRIEISPDADAVTGSIFTTGTLVGSLATKTFIPNYQTSAGGSEMTAFAGLHKTLGAGALTFDVDYLDFRQEFTGSRF